MADGPARVGFASQRRRDVLRLGGGLAAASLAMPPIIARAAAETVNIGALYPVTGNLAQIGQGFLGLVGKVGWVVAVVGGVLGPHELVLLA